VVCYEPRREGSGDGGRGGRQAYFAIARVRSIEPDRKMGDHFYAFVSDYLEFRRAVPFRLGGEYPERGLRKADGSVNKGRARNGSPRAGASPGVEAAP
jgi:putative restriction endonuclease